MNKAALAQRRRDLKTEVAERYPNLEWHDDRFYGSRAELPDGTEVVVLADTPEGCAPIGGNWDPEWNRDNGRDIVAQDEPMDGLALMEPSDLDDPDPHCLRFGPLGMEVKGKPSYRQLYSFAAIGLRAHRSFPWNVGDALNAMRSGWGEQWAQILTVAQELHYSPHTLRQWMNVTARVPINIRQEGPSWDCWRRALSPHADDPEMVAAGIRYYLEGHTTDETKDELARADCPENVGIEAPEFDLDANLESPPVPSSPRAEVLDALRCPVCNRALSETQELLIDQAWKEILAFAKDGEVGPWLHKLRGVADG